MLSYVDTFATKRKYLKFRIKRFRIITFQNFEGNSSINSNLCSTLILIKEIMSVS